MQSVSAAFSAEAEDLVRRVAHSLLVSWKREDTLGNRTFTIGVSTIGGNDVIGVNPGAIGSPGNYKYFDESDNVLELGWEKSLNIPLGGFAKGMGEARLDNTSNRYTPRYMGGNSELYTSILPRRPFIINAGFEVGGIDQTVPQFSGIVKDLPTINVENREVGISGYDFSDYFDNKYLDRTAMYTGVTTDTIIEDVFQSAGMSTAQYDLDVGLNTIQFALFEVGDKLKDILHELAESENGHVFQDETGKYYFWNRQHWTLPPYNEVQKVIYTAQVMGAESLSTDNLINTVEIKSSSWAKRPLDTIFTLASPKAIPANGDVEIFVQFDNPVLQLETPTGWLVNTEEGGSTGTDFSSSVALKSVDLFARVAKIILTNNSANEGYVNSLTLRGRMIEQAEDVYVRSSVGVSVTAYDERPKTIENKYIQNQDWAESLARLLLNRYSEPDRLQRLTIRAIPQLQFGDLISWQGGAWRVYGISSRISKSSGFVQELLISQSEETSVEYFTIGLSTIGGEAIIAA